MKQQQQNPESTLYHSGPFKGGQWPRDYYTVAIVRSVDLEEVFKLTNSDDHLSEDELALVTWLRPGRSIMVGDVVENDSGIFRCEPSGWQRI